MAVMEINPNICFLEVTTTDDIEDDVEDLDEVESEARFRREVPKDVEVDHKLAKIAFPHDGASNNGKSILFLPTHSCPLS